MNLQSLWALRLPLAFVAGVVLILQLLGGLDRLDNALGDALLRQQAKHRVPPDDIVIVAIDQRSLEELNEIAGSWPWPRIIHGELIDNLARFRPSAIAFDIHLNEPDYFRPDSDLAFKEIAST
ncbi:MAG TPA: CHASE2 domain-containing protein, partial [Arenimonas sp.]|nr:CHASE2 domain-containing protein [Arenimonas sp.]